MFSFILLALASVSAFTGSQADSAPVANDVSFLQASLEFHQGPTQGADGKQGADGRVGRRTAGGRPVREEYYYYGQDGQGGGSGSGCPFANTPEFSQCCDTPSKEDGMKCVRQEAEKLCRDKIGNKTDGEGIAKCVEGVMKDAPTDAGCPFTEKPFSKCCSEASVEDGMDCVVQTAVDECEGKLKGQNRPNASDADIEKCVDGVLKDAPMPGKGKGPAGANTDIGSGSAERPEREERPKKERPERASSLYAKKYKATRGGRNRRQRQVQSRQLAQLGAKLKNQTDPCFAPCKKCDDCHEKCGSDEECKKACEAKGGICGACDKCDAAEDPCFAPCKKCDGCREKCGSDEECKACEAKGGICGACDECDVTEAERPEEDDRPPVTEEKTGPETDAN